MLFPPVRYHSCVIQFPKLSPSIVCYRNHYFSWGNLFRFLHEKKKKRIKWCPLVTQKVQIEEDIFLLLIVSLDRNGISHLLLHKYPPAANPFVKSQRINKKTRGEEKSNDISNIHQFLKVGCSYFFLTHHNSRRNNQIPHV